MLKLKEKYKTKYFSIADFNQLPKEALAALKKDAPELIYTYFIEEWYKQNFIITEMMVFM